MRRTVWKPLLTAAAASFIAMGALSALPRLLHGGDGSEITVFRPAAPVRLANDNLVDAMLSLRLDERPRRVEWRGSVLIVDMEAGPQTPLGDLDKLIGLAFRQSGNTERLLVRFFVPSSAEAASEEDVLLLAADIRAGDRWLKRYDGLPDDPGRLADPVWRSRLRLSLTDEWNRRYGEGGGRQW